jgi:hypothetical protein
MNAVPVTTRCPACRDDVTTQRDTYIYAYGPLCVTHKQMWTDADERAHGAKTGCPHYPRQCPKCERRSA